MSEDGVEQPFARKSIGVDVAKYQAMLDAPEVSEEEKRKSLEALWRFMVTFVDIGFEFHPLSFPCGKLPNPQGSDSDEAQHVLSLDEILKHNFEEVATRERQRDGKESGNGS